MKYPLYVWKDKGSAYGATFPDLPGVNTSGETLEELERNAQEAVELMYEDGDQDVPAPTHDINSLRRMFSKDDGGFWLFVEIDLTKIGSKAVRLNISLPDRLVQQIDAAAKARRMTRSAFLALAAQHEMEHA